MKSLVQENEANVYTTKSDIVHKVLKQKIIDGELAMGESINITKIAAELNISIIPVREGLKRLETEGLVEFFPHKGAQVKTFSSTKIKEIYDIRAVLEGLAAREAIAHLDPDKIEQLKAMNEQMRQYANEADDERFGQANKDFHRFMYQNAQYPTLFDMIFNLWEGHWTKAIFAFHPERMHDAVAEHDAIIEAIEAKDGVKTEQLVRAHKLKTAKLFETISKETKE
ncbi:GntR family transcriptional regulator [Brevibacillus centrosporus]|uniref:GntR family transcriptional regulator n=1 Tax=Brevibacillus centrosporus TaxID=54910 RepID=UPI002E1F2173|nr:GntR family transcriptional regulator [Brevibacillus centrosporus]